MAVARIKADSRWFRRVARLTADQPRLSRELLRAVERPGHTAELTGSEVRVLALRLPADQHVEDAMDTVLTAEAAEREGAQRLRALMDARRGSPPLQRGDS